ncbi:MAG: hypothetical protein VYC42_08985 [Pseudomonadota bacterium]|nr:hypothetical protein [Pseudomonadota bacterium]
MSESKITVSEFAISGVQRAEVIRCGDKLVLLIDDQPFQIDLDRATLLAWSICTQIDAIRSAEIDRAADRYARVSDHADVMPFAA